MSKNPFMKKTALVISMIFIVLQLVYISPIKIASASIDYSWNNNVPVKYPAPGNSNGKLILFDNSHGETTGQADWTLDGGFSDFADDRAPRKRGKQLVRVA